MTYTLEKFKSEYGKIPVKEIASALGVKPTVVGIGASLLVALGEVDPVERKRVAVTPEWDTEKAEDLFKKGVKVKEIAAYLKVKALSVTAHLKRVGLIAKPVSISEALGETQTP